MSLLTYLLGKNPGGGIYNQEVPRNRRPPVDTSRRQRPPGYTPTGPKTWINPITGLGNQVGSAANTVLDENINNPAVSGVSTGMVDSVTGRENVNTATNTAALDFLNESRTRLEQLFGNRTDEIERLISSAPFTDELLQSQKQAGYNEIQSQLDPLLQQTQVNFASRGLGRSSMAQNAGGALRGQAISGRANILNDLLNKQFQTNTEASRFKQGLLSQVEGMQAGFENRLGGLEAGIKAGNVIDPETISRIMGDALSADTGIMNQEQMFDLVNRMLNQEQSSAPLNNLSQLVTAALPNAPGFTLPFNILTQWLNSVFNPVPRLN